jgi:hypothetical protein
MQKIISLFQRNYDGDRLVRDEIVPGAEWVQAGEGVATRKWDGTACLVRDGKLYRRYDAKNGKAPPAGWEAAQEPDPVTGHWPGWLEVDVTAPENKWYTIAWANNQDNLPDGTYELCGPHFQSNPEHFVRDQFVQHGLGVYEDCPRDFEGLKSWFNGRDIEGIVWHHPDGRMVKIKAKDLGIKRGLAVA